MSLRTLAVSLLLIAGTLAGQTLQVTGALKQPLSLTASDLAGMPRRSAKLTNKDAVNTYEGVPLAEILKRAGVPQGEALQHGGALVGYLVAEGSDGYRVVFSLAEVDPAFVDSGILVADTMDGKPIAGKLGPLRLVVPKDKPGSRSVRMLTKIEVVLLRK